MFVVVFVACMSPSCGTVALNFFFLFLRVKKRRKEISYELRFHRQCVSVLFAVVLFLRIYLILFQDNENQNYRSLTIFSIQFQFNCSNCHSFGEKVLFLFCLFGFFWSARDLKSIQNLEDLDYLYDYLSAESRFSSSLAVSVFKEFANPLLAYLRTQKRPKMMLTLLQLVILYKFSVSTYYHLTLRVPDEGFSRNTSYTLNLIFTFCFIFQLRIKITCSIFLAFTRQD